MSSVCDDIEPVDGGPVTFINVFEVPVEQIGTFIARWRERAKIMSTAPGFRDLRLHRARPKDALMSHLMGGHHSGEEALAAVDDGLDRLFG